MNGKEYLYKFDVENYYLHKDYNSKGSLEGTDIALAVVKLDRSDPDFDDEMLKKVYIPPIKVIPNDQIDALRGSEIRILGYPNTICHPQSHSAQKNHNYLYEDHGPIANIILDQKTSRAIILSQSEQIVTSIGQDGGEI